MTGEWQPIGKLGSLRDKLGHNQVVIAKIVQHMDENGDPEGDPVISWAHVAYPTSMGWQCGTGGFRGVHGFASFPLLDATDFLILPSPPAEGR